MPRTVEAAALAADATVVAALAGAVAVVCPPAKVVGTAPTPESASNAQNHDLQKEGRVKLPPSREVAVLRKSVIYTLLCQVWANCPGPMAMI